MTSQLNDIPTKTENKKLEELFLAIYFNDLEKVVAFKNQFPDLYAKKHKFIIDKEITFDLINLTWFNKILWFDINWKEDMDSLVEKYQQRTKQMLAFWQTEVGRQLDQRPIEYNYYYDYFYCADPNNPDANEEVICDNIHYFIEQGFREIDLRLYNRIECFDFIEVKNLLEKGANTNIPFYGYGDSSAFSRVSCEVMVLSSCYVIPEFEEFESKGYNQHVYIKDMFSNILGMAAHTEMYNLLKEYDNEE